MEAAGAHIQVFVGAEMTPRVSVTDPNPLPGTGYVQLITGRAAAGGLGTYWPQFPGLLPQLQQSAAYVSERFEAMGADVTDVGFISDAEAGAAAAERLRAADCDLIVLFLTTYLTSSMVWPIAQRAHAPVLVIDLQPTEAMDHASFDTGAWLAYCGQCPVPEVGNVFRRAGIPFRSVSGWLHQESAWERIVQHGRVTLLGLGQDADGSLSFIASEGVTVPGPLLAIGNTTSRVDFGRDPGEWVDEWSATGVGHHWSLSVGHRSAEYEAAASLLGIDFRQV